jgi:hypothetical protein
MIKLLIGLLASALLVGCATVQPPVVSPVVKPEVPVKPAYQTTNVSICKQLPEKEQLVCAFRLTAASLEQCDNYSAQLLELLK